MKPKGMRLNTFIFTFLVAAVAAICFASAKEEVAFSSEAKLLVRLAIDRPGAEGDKKAPDANALVNDEVEILVSQDLLLSVAKAIGSEKLLGHADPGGMDDAKAAKAIRDRLEVRIRKDSALISLRFQHADPAVAQQVLDQLIKERYEQELRKPQFNPDPTLVNIVVVQKPSKPSRIENGLVTRLLRKLGKPEAEGDGDQPATAVESKAAGEEKPKTEAEGRSQ